MFGTTPTPTMTKSAGIGSPPASTTSCTLPLPEKASTSVCSDLHSLAVVDSGVKRGNLRRGDPFSTRSVASRTVTFMPSEHSEAAVSNPM